MRTSGVFLVILAISVCLALGLTLMSCENPGGSTTYTVSFDANGGSGKVPGPRTVPAGSSITLPGGSGLTKTGYTFDGWWYNVDLYTVTVYSVGDSFTPTGDITLYANWVEIPYYYTVTFDANGGDGTPPPDQIVPAYSSITLPGGDGLTKDGYYFFMWNTEPDGTGFFWTEYTPDGDSTLYAIWYPVYIPPSYTVTFDANGGDGTPPSEQIVQDGDGIILPDGNGLTRTGYTFGGWSDYTSGTETNYSAGEFFTPPTDYTILYAKWNPITYIIAYDKNAPDADGTMANSSHTYDAFDNSLNDNGFTRAGYFFIGWARTSTGEVEFRDGAYGVWNLTAVAGETITLYAVWVEEGSNPIWTVRFEPNGGSGTPPPPQTVQSGSGPITIPDGSGLTRTGYTFFGGWSDNASGNGTYYSVGTPLWLDRDITLYAMWNPITYTIAYDKNAPDAAGTMANSSYQYDWDVTLINNFTRDGYTFIGWAKTSTGGVDFSVDEPVRNLTTVAGETVTLYAVWEVVTQTVKIEYYWVDQHGSLVTTNGGATTIIAGQTLIITAQGDGYSVRHWDLNGIPALQGNTSQSGNTYYFSSTIPGKHIVGLFVEKDGKLYNTNITIMVLP